MLGGASRYQQFLGAPEGIPTNILADRLKKMEEVGLVTKRQYSDHKRRFEYLPTQRCRDLFPVVQEIARWGQKHVQDAWNPPDWFWEGTP